MGIKNDQTFRSLHSTKLKNWSFDRNYRLQSLPSSKTRNSRVLDFNGRLVFLLNLETSSKLLPNKPSGSQTFGLDECHFALWSNKELLDEEQKKISEFFDFKDEEQSRPEKCFPLRKVLFDAKHSHRSILFQEQVGVNQRDWGDTHSIQQKVTICAQRESLKYLTFRLHVWK